jgi:hypothetical protein
MGVEEAVEEDAVVLEREVPLLRHSVECRDARGELRRAVRLEQRTDPRDLVVARGRVRRADALLPPVGQLRRREVDVLELGMDGAPDRRAGSPSCPTALDVDGAHPRDALGEVAVRARLEERERREREPAHVVDRGRRIGASSGSVGAGGGSGGNPPSSKSASCPGSASVSARPPRARGCTAGRNRSTRSSSRAPPRTSSTGSAAARSNILVALQLPEHPPHRRRRVGLLLPVDRAGDDQPSIASVIAT